MKVCSIGDCDRPVHAWGMCNSHYIRQRRGHDIAAPMEHRGLPQTPDRIMQRIADRTVVDGSTGCVLFTGKLSNCGYGMISVGGRDMGTHRLALMYTAGPPPADRPHALHSCDRPACVNPDHLRWGSHAENMRDMYARGRRRPRAQAS